MLSRDIEKESDIQKALEEAKQKIAMNELTINQLEETQKNKGE